MKNGWYLISGAAVGIAAASVLILVATPNSTKSENQNLIFTAKLEQTVLNSRADREEVFSSEGDIRIILASPYANVTANEIR